MVEIPCNGVNHVNPDVDPKYDHYNIVPYGQILCPECFHTSLHMKESMRNKTDRVLQAFLNYKDIDDILARGNRQIQCSDNYQNLFNVKLGTSDLDFDYTVAVKIAEELVTVEPEDPGTGEGGPGTVVDPDDPSTGEENPPEEENPDVEEPDTDLPIVDVDSSGNPVVVESSEDRVFVLSEDTGYGTTVTSSTDETEGEEDTTEPSTGDEETETPDENLPTIVSKKFFYFGLNGTVTMKNSVNREDVYMGVPTSYDWKFDISKLYKVAIEDIDVMFTAGIRENVHMWVDEIVDEFMSYLAAEISPEDAAIMYQPNDEEEDKPIYVCRCEPCNAGCAAEQYGSASGIQHCICCNTQVGTVYYVNIANQILCVRCAYSQAVKELANQGCCLNDRPPLCATDDQINSWLSDHLKQTTLKKYVSF